MARAIKWQIESRKILPLPDNLTWESFGIRFRNELEKLM
jgi:hypothetical protein